MKKAILISIRPEWVEKILNEEKTIEIRKTEPKCELPIDVYIYCTHGYSLTHLTNDATRFCVHQFKDDDKKMKCVGTSELDGPLNGKVVAKFTLKEVEKFDFISEIKHEGNAPKYNEEIRKHNRICKEACISPFEVVRYLDTKCLGSNNPLGMIGYAWHISDLEVFDEPKELSEFFSLPKTYHHDYESMVDYYRNKEERRLKRAPQSWSYVEVE